MTDGAILSTLVQTAGRPFPAAVSRAPSENGPAREDKSASARIGESGKAADPVVPRQTPLLNTESQLAAQQPGEPTAAKSGEAAGQTPAEGADEGAKSGAVTDPSNPENLTDEEQQKVEELKRRDREVRAHEQAHKAAGGSLAGSPSFETVRGPDGKSYAVSGEVQIDTSAVPNNPEATIRKLKQVKRAALAPANPSGQDRRVAAEAEAKIQAARQEKREKEAEELEKATEKQGGEPADPAAASRRAADSNPLAPAPVIPAATGGASSSVRPGALFDLVA